MPDIYDYIRERDKAQLKLGECAWLLQRVVTYRSPVEAFATGIKMESSDQHSFLEPIKGSRRILSD